MPSEGGAPRRLTYLGSEALYCVRLVARRRFDLLHLRRGSPFSKETLAFRIDADGGEPVRARARTRDDARRRGERRDAARAQRDRSGALEAVPRRHRRTPVGRRARRRRVRAHLPRRSTATSSGRCGSASAIVFLSDHEGIGNLYSVAPDGSDLRRHTDEREHYARFPATDGTRVVYACGGELVLLDPRDDSVRRIGVETPSNALETARRFIDAGELLECWDPSHDGTALALVTRGRVYTMPLWEDAVTEHGVCDDGARRRLLTWLHDDKHIAYVDDAAGFQRIAIAPVDQSAPPRYLTSEDHGRAARARRLARRRAARVREQPSRAVADRRRRTAAQARHAASASAIDDLVFSPDGRWLAYIWSPKDAHVDRPHRRLRDRTRSIDATTPLREDRSPAWDPDGDYLYFISTRDFHPVYDALQFELSFPEASRPYLVTLRADIAEPVRSEARAAAQVAATTTMTTTTTEGPQARRRDRRRRPRAADAGVSGRRRRIRPHRGGKAPRALLALSGARDPAASRTTTTVTKAASCSPTTSRSNAARRWRPRSTTSCSAAMRARWCTPRAGSCARSTPAAICPKKATRTSPRRTSGRRSGWLDLGRVSVLVEPRAEWRQMLHEAWRLQRENFWDAADVRRRLGRGAAALRSAAAAGPHAQRALRPDLGDARRARHLARVRERRRQAAAAAVQTRVPRRRRLLGRGGRRLPHRAHSARRSVESRRRLAARRAGRRRARRRRHRRDRRTRARGVLRPRRAAGQPSRGATSC